MMKPIPQIRHHVQLICWGFVKELLIITSNSTKLIHAHTHSPNLAHLPPPPAPLQTHTQTHRHPPRSANACRHRVIDSIQIARLFSGAWRNDITLITTSKYKQSHCLTDKSVYMHVCLCLCVCGSPSM